MDNQEIKKLREDLDKIANKVEVLDDILLGDADRRIVGVVDELKNYTKELETLLNRLERWGDVEAFMRKWTEREYMVKGVVWLISGSSIISLLTFLFTVFGGGGGE